MAESYVRFYGEAMKQKEIQRNLKYKEKYHKLRKIIKSIVIENAALCDQVALMQQNVAQVKKERFFLLKKLLELQSESESPTLTCKSISSNVNSSISNADVKKFTKKKGPCDINDKSQKKRPVKYTGKVVKPIPLDVNGKPIFPITLGDLTVYSLGEIITDRLSYHKEDIIYPVGYCSTRVYASLKDVRMKTMYTCKILDGGMSPRFEIASDSELDKSFEGSTPDECLSALLTAISPSLSSIPVRGAEFFGISHPTIQNLIQFCPGTRKLAIYRIQKFETSKSADRESPIIDEETDPSLGFNALHRYFISSYKVKEEPTNELLNFQNILS